ncbi:Protein translocase subunit SecA [Tetrabaena socialis]|uniref:chloroplast protein-transporting ATPase n=1 Tax=Tetrabaena socialis TaxID=47790 RepID=A0A2J7ZGC6_9CHLO|nr:Protein translocase subunit SecA [Tetrabaena socialis]|eukprot:PNG99316.1 Protein translocase subunit SecA [Tetrabaena socialis]
MLLGHSGRLATGRLGAGRHAAPLLPPCARPSTRPIAGRAVVGSLGAGLRGAPAMQPRRSTRGAVRVQAFLKNIFRSDPSVGTRKKYQARVDQINALEPAMQALTDDQLRAKTLEFKERVRKGESLESVLPEAFAVSGSA